MTNTELARLAADTAWIERVKVALVEAAIAISVDAPATGIATRRDALARKILRDPDGYARQFSLGVATGFKADANLSEQNVTDAEIDARVTAVFNDYVE